MIAFNKDDIKFLHKRKKDNICRVFMWKHCLFRGIYSEYETHIRALFTTGLVDKLISLGYFPKTYITDYQMDGFSLIIEHETIWPITYPQEWIFGNRIRERLQRLYSANQKMWERVIEVLTSC